jgi:hypothetical protein
MAEKTMPIIGIGHWQASRLAASRLFTLLLALLDWRARHRAIGAEDAAVSLLGLQQFRTTFAVIKELAEVGGHGLGVLVPTVRAGDRGLQLDRTNRLFQSAKAMRPIKNTNAGKRTESINPSAAENPTNPSSTTRSGVKQHSATITLPTMPIPRSLFSFIAHLCFGR